MFFYKHLDDKGNVVQAESRSVQAINAPEIMVEISENEYQELLEKLFADIKELPIEQSKTYQRGYEQALLDMAEVGV